MRIAVLWTCLSGYLNACLRELASRDGVELFVCNQPLDSQAPFDDSQFAWIPNRFLLQDANDSALLEPKLRAFDPEILLFCSWNVPAYRRIARQFAKRAFRVMAMDNCWQATAKQRMGTLISPWFIRPLADAVWLPGEPQAGFAKRLGFGERNILRGLYSCDQPKIESAYLSRVAVRRPLPRVFLFVGRFVKDKGVEQLVRAYELYRDRSTAPWPLICCGAGPLEPHLKGRPMIHVEGFVQPDRLGDKLASAGCLVLPSTFEPWGVVVHEAVSAGLVILASSNVGAAAALVRDDYNGYMFDSHDVNRLSALLSQVSNLSDERLDSMSRASHLLSSQFSPAQWTETLLRSHAHR